MRNPVWVLKLRYKFLKNTPDYLISGFFFALPAAIVFTPFVILRWETTDLNYLTLLRLLSGCIWAYWGPYFMFRYDKHYLKIWHSIFHEKPESSINEYVLKYDSRIRRIAALLTLIWSALIGGALLLSVEYLLKFGFVNYSDPYLYLFIGFVFLLIHYTAIGITGSFMTILIIKEIVENNLIEYDIYASDSVGGYSVLGNFALNTTLLYSTGVLFIPILYDFVIDVNITSQILVFLGVMIYAISIFASFLIPVTYTFKHAESQKEKILQDQLEYYKELKMKVSKTSNDYYEERSVFNLIQYVRQLDVYPFNFNSLTKVILTGLFPIVLYVVQLFLDPDSILYNWDAVVEKLF